MSDVVMVARAALHYWEEECISGTAGSGAVFFCGCNLRCVFCQNREIVMQEEAPGAHGVSIPVLADVFLRLQAQGANNINLVTPTHYVPSIREALILAKDEGLRIPIVYNCGGYESVGTLRMLDGLVDIYLPDDKYHSAELAGSYSHAVDYPEVAEAAIAEMYRQVGEAVFDERGMMRRGVIVRHLVLPGHTREAKEVLARLFARYQNHIFYSIMNQYTPLAYVREHYPKLGRGVTKREYGNVVDYAVSLGIENGFIQEGKTVSESFIPAFDGTGMEPENDGI